MKNIHLYLLSLVCIFCFSSCEEEEILLIDSELQPYFERFQEEAALRGKDIDFVELRIEGKLADLEGVGGNCTHNTVDPDLVQIDYTFWTAANDLGKEFIVFHELGHCALNRSHLDTQNSDGTCLSLMHSGNSGCRNVYASNTRDSYLDELFE